MVNHKAVVLAVILASVLLHLPLLSKSAYASGGTMTGEGTADNPYIVEDSKDMAAVANDLTK